MRGDKGNEGGMEGEGERKKGRNSTLQTLLA